MKQNDINEMVTRLGDKKTRTKTIIMAAAATLNNKTEEYCKTPEEIDDMLTAAIEQLLILKGEVMAICAANKEDQKQNPIPVKVEYNKETNIVTFGITEDAISPGYLKYLLEYLNIPADVKIVYKEQTEPDSTLN